MHNGLSNNSTISIYKVLHDHLNDILPDLPAFSLKELLECTAIAVFHEYVHFIIIVNHSYDADNVNVVYHCLESYFIIN